MDYLKHACTFSNFTNIHRRREQRELLEYVSEDIEAHREKNQRVRTDCRAFSRLRLEFSAFRSIDKEGNSGRSVLREKFETF